MPDFKLNPAYTPTADQPQAIAGLAEGLAADERFLTLLGATGHREDLHDGRGDRAAPAARARDRPQQDPRRAALQRVPRVLARERGRVLRQLLRLLPARGLRARAGPLHREGLVDQRRDRPAPPLGHRRAAGPSRRGDRRLGLVHLRDRVAPALPRADAAVQGRRLDRPRRAVPEADRDAVRTQRHQPHPRHLPGQGRAPGGVSRLRRDRLPDRAVRRRGRVDPALRPAHRARCSTRSTTSRCGRRPTT